MKTTGPSLGHEVRYEREVIEMPSSNGWRERIPGAGARAWCTCGQLDTGFVDAAKAREAAREHVTLYLPGTPFDGEEKTP